MDKTIVIFGALALALAAVAAGMIVASGGIREAPMTYASPAQPDSPATSNDLHNPSLTLAEQFVMADPTFKFDGIADTLKAELDDTGDPAVATVNFTSRNAGYGDRAGMMLAAVLTPHQCVLKISGGQVISAVMDGKWDMISQKELEH